MPKAQYASPEHRTLYHITHRTNLRGVYRRGLDPSKSTIADKRVWLCEPGELTRVAIHLSWVHKVPVTELVILEVQIDAALILEHSEGIYHCPHLIPPAWILNKGPVSGR